jgi:hypothetical protein
MSRTKHIFKGVEYPAKTKRKLAEKKHFGHTSGTHSEFEKTKAYLKKEFERTDPSDAWYALRKKRWEQIKDKAYPVAGEDYVKYGYGNGRNKNK